MPMLSKAQRGAMFSASQGKSTLGIPKSVGKKFVAHDQGGSLPDYATPKADRRDYAKGGPVKGYLWGGGVTPANSPIEVAGHWGPKSVSEESSWEDSEGSSSMSGSSTGVGPSGAQTGQSSGQSSSSSKKGSFKRSQENW